AINIQPTRAIFPSLCTRNVYSLQRTVSPRRLAHQTRNDSTSVTGTSQSARKVRDALRKTPLTIAEDNRRSPRVANARVRISGDSQNVTNPISAQTVP